MARFSPTPDLERYERMAAEFDPALVDASPYDENLHVTRALHRPYYITPRLRRTLSSGKLTAIRSAQMRLQEMFATHDEQASIDRFERGQQAYDHSIGLIQTLGEQAIQHS
jgi:hypothetical protein